MKRKITVATTLMIVLLTVVATFNITFFASAEYYNRRLGDLQELESRYAKLRNVAETVDKYFIGDFTEKDAVEGAAAGYVDGLGDQWSHYFTKEQTERILAEEANSYVGVGLTYSIQETDRYTVLSVIMDGPAAQAGIKVGDVLVAVDGIPVTQLGENDELSTYVKGEEGTQVSITVRRGSAEKTYTMKRASVFNEGVKAKMLPNNIGYLAISGFDTNVDVEFKTKLQSLVDQGAKGLIFDVRWNPGGFLEVMRNMLDLVLPEGVVISTVDKQGSVTEYSSDKNCLSLPMAVVVNADSVSAAEFFAAALQEYGVADVVGAHTGGKGYSQQLIRLTDGSSINLSTTRYYTPKGANLAGVGIAPDHEVAMDMDYATFYYLDPAKDVQLQKAVSVVKDKIAEAAKNAAVPTP